MNIEILAATLFLPIFPLSMLFNALLDRSRPAALKIVLLLAWPQVGLALIHGANQDPPGWLIALALFTSLFYGFRALVLRELTHWIGFLAVSSWTLLWLVAGFEDNAHTLRMLALGSSIPLGVLVLLGARLEKQFGASYAGLYNGLGHSMPRFSAVLVCTILAVIGTPVFPVFVTMIMAFLETVEARSWASVTLCLIWLMWGWAGARMIQGFVIGDDQRTGLEDLSKPLTWAFTLLLTGLAIFGFLMMGGLS